MEQRARDPFSGNRNWHYIAQGNRSILPLEVFDNGFSTVFRFPGNVRIPSVFVINPDGKRGDCQIMPSRATWCRSTLSRGDGACGMVKPCCASGTGRSIRSARNPETGTTSPERATRVVKEAFAMSDTGYNARLAE